MSTYKSIIYEKSKNIADLFLYKSLEEIMQEIQKKDLSNIESIDSGITGILFYLLEFYACSKDVVYLKKVEDLSEELINYCKENKTNNFSLYTGRGGFVYFLLILYSVNKNHLLVEESVSLLKSVEEEYLSSEYTSDYLYDGRAGTLLLLAFLYKISNSDMIASHISKCMENIMENAIWNGAGLSWKAINELNLGNSVGFAFGASGIRYVLTIVNHLVKDGKLQMVIANVDKYIQENWNENFQNWRNNEIKFDSRRDLDYYKDLYQDNNRVYFIPKYNDYSWASGKTGILISEVTENMEFQPGDSCNHLTSFSIFNGKAGLGLYLLQHTYIEAGEDYIQGLIQEFLNTNFEKDLFGNIMHGGLGIAYFLLKTISIKKDDLLTCPLIFLFDNEALLNDTDQKLNISPEVITRSIVYKYFTRTISLLEIVNSQIFTEFWNLSANNETENNLIHQFKIFMDKILIQKKETPIYNLLDDIFNYEKSKLDIILSKKSSLDTFLEQLYCQDQKAVLLNKSDEYLFGVRLKVSSQIVIKSSRWDWSVYSNSGYLANFCNPPSYFEYILLPSYNGLILEYSLKIDGLVLHRFDQPKTINEALLEIKYFCQTQPKDVIEEISRNTGSIDVEDFINRLDFLIVHKIKHLIFNGILEVAEE